MHQHKKIPTSCHYIAPIYCTNILITLFTGNGAILGKEDVFVAARKFLEAASKQLLYGLVETTQADIICGVPAVEER